jgi:hypothetical protein
MPAPEAVRPGLYGVSMTGRPPVQVWLDAGGLGNQSASFSRQGGATILLPRHVKWFGWCAQRGRPDHLLDHRPRSEHLEAFVRTPVLWKTRSGAWENAWCRTRGEGSRARRFHHESGDRTAGTFGGSSGHLWALRQSGTHGQYPIENKNDQRRSHENRAQHNPLPYG